MPLTGENLMDEDIKTQYIKKSANTGMVTGIMKP